MGKKKGTREEKLARKALKGEDDKPKMSSPVLEVLNKYFFGIILVIVCLTGILAHQASLIALNNPSTKGGRPVGESRVALGNDNPLDSGASGAMPGFRDMQEGRSRPSGSPPMKAQPNTDKYDEPTGALGWNRHDDRALARQTKKTEDTGEGWAEATRLALESAKAGDQSEALGYFKIALDMKPDTFSAMNYGVALMRSNRLDEALENLLLSEQLDKKKENKDLASNLSALRQHLDYRAGTRTTEEIAEENAKARAWTRRDSREWEKSGKKEPSLSYQGNKNAFQGKNERTSAGAGKYDF